MAVKGGCIFLAKILLFIFNFILWTGGGCLFGYALYLRFDLELKSEEDTSQLEGLEFFFTGLYVLMVTGGVIMIIGFLGCCGAIKENICQLSLYFISVSVVIVAEIGAGVWIYLNQDKVIDSLNEHMDDAYTQDFNKFIDILQEKLQCCGVEGPDDWEKSGGSIPASCGNVASNSTADDHVKYQGIQTVGCVDRFHQYITTIGIIVCGIIFLQILVIVLSIILCRAIRDADEYDDDDQSFS